MPNSMDDALLTKTYTEQQWQRYKQPFVRDLAYAISCPTALTHWDVAGTTSDIQVHSSQFWQQQFVAYQQRLQQLDDINQNHYQPLVDWLQSRPSPHRLGFHFEGLILFWLIDGYQHGCHQLEVLQHNIQMFAGKQTLGEIDAIIYNHKTGEIEHWELAIKFYLGSPPYHPVNWVGINSKDNLEKKMQHMQTKSFCHQQIKDSNSNDYIAIDKRMAVIKGRFFVKDLPNFIRPNWLNSDFPLHHWFEIKSSEINTTEQLKKLITQQSFDGLQMADYVEWFTYRLDRLTRLSKPSKTENKNVDSLSGGTYSIDNNQPTTDVQQQVKTGLYFYQISNNKIDHDNQNQTSPQLLTELELETISVTSSIKLSPCVITVDVKK